MAAARATKYDKGVLVFEQVGVERAVEVSEALDRGNQIDLVLAFRSLLETDLILPDSPFPRTAALIMVSIGPQAALFQVLGALHRTFDLLESVRGVLDVAVTAAVDGPAPPTPTPRVQRLEFRNPLELVLFGAVAVATGAAMIVKRVARSVGEVADAAAKVQGVAHAKNEEQRRQERHDVELKSLQLDNLKKAVEVAELLETVQPTVIEVAGVEIPELPPAARARAEGLKDQAVEATAELFVSGADEVTIATEPPTDQ